MAYREIDMARYRLWKKRDENSDGTSYNHSHVPSRIDMKQLCRVFSVDTKLNPSLYHKSNSRNKPKRVASACRAYQQ